jgi:DNA-binding LacI/PurR family transcriptional regulator
LPTSDYNVWWGFDDFHLAQWVDPPLTTVRPPGLETGRFPERRVELATELVRRGSSQRGEGRS